jgi:hypothetical protein
VARFDLRLVCAERDNHRIVIGISVDRGGEPFQYFECWASRTGDVSFLDRQRLVAAAVNSVADRLVAHIQPLSNPTEAIIVPIESHPTRPVVSSLIAAALLDLTALNAGLLQPPTILTIEVPNWPVSSSRTRTVAWRLDRDSLGLSIYRRRGSKPSA